MNFCDEHSGRHHGEKFRRFSERNRDLIDLFFLIAFVASLVAGVVMMVGCASPVAPKPRVIIGYYCHGEIVKIGALQIPVCRGREEPVYAP